MGLACMTLVLAVKTGEAIDIGTLIPTDCCCVVRIDVPKILNHPLVTELRPEKRQARLEDFVARTSIDPRMDLDVVYLVGERPGHHRGAAVLFGQFDEEKLDALAQSKADGPSEQIGSVSVYTFKNGAEAGAMLDGETLVIGTSDIVKRLVSRSEGLEPTPATPGVAWQMLSGMPAETAVNAVVLAPPDGQPSGKRPVLEALSSITASIDLDQALTGEITATTKKTADASHVFNMLTGLRSLATLRAKDHFPLSQFLDGLTLEQTENGVKVSFEIELDTIREAVERKHSAIG